MRAKAPPTTMRTPSPPTSKNLGSIFLLRQIEWINSQVADQSRLRCYVESSSCPRPRSQKIIKKAPANTATPATPISRIHDMNYPRDSDDSSSPPRPINQ